MEKDSKLLRKFWMLTITKIKIDPIHLKIFIITFYLVLMTIFLIIIQINILILMKINLEL